MLVVFESTVVKQRQRNMANLRRMRRPPQSCLVYREGAWCNISTLALLPGDIFSVRRSTALSEGHDNNEQLVPCDVLLLQGSCVVRNAIFGTSCFRQHLYQEFPRSMKPCYQVNPFLYENKLCKSRRICPTIILKLKKEVR